jgi:hypothetical protein
MFKKYLLVEYCRALIELTSRTLRTTIIGYNKNDQLLLLNLEVHQASSHLIVTEGKLRQQSCGACLRLYGW